MRRVAFALVALVTLAQVAWAQDHTRPPYILSFVVSMPNGTGHDYETRVVVGTFPDGRARCEINKRFIRILLQAKLERNGWGAAEISEGSCERPGIPM